MLGDLGDGELPSRSWCACTATSFARTVMPWPIVRLRQSLQIDRPASPQGRRAASCSPERTPSQGRRSVRHDCGPVHRIMKSRAGARNLLNALRPGGPAQPRADATGQGPGRPSISRKVAATTSRRPNGESSTGHHRRVWPESGRTRRCELLTAAVSDAENISLAAPRSRGSSADRGATDVLTGHPNQGRGDSRTHPP